MKDYFKFRENLTEAKVTMAKLRPGLKVNLIWKGASARNYGISGENVFDGKVQILGMGNVPYGKKASPRHVFAKDYKDAQKKFKDIWTKEEVRYGYHGSALNKLRYFFNEIAAESDGKKIPYGHASWIFKVLEGPEKGYIGYCYVSNDEKWEIRFLNKAAEFSLET